MKKLVNKFWFKRKSYGWGWTPSTWQGWMILALFVAMVIFNAKRLEKMQLPENIFAINFAIETAILVLILMIICYLTGEDPKWQWGRKD